MHSWIEKGLVIGLAILGLGKDKVRLVAEDLAKGCGHSVHGHRRGAQLPVRFWSEWRRVVERTGQCMANDDYISTGNNSRVT